MKQVVVISGVAQGMGREVTKLLAARGHSVAGFDVDADGIASLERELSSSSAKHYVTTLDVTDQKGILEFRNKVLERYGRVDTVLSNVGVGFLGPFEEVDLGKALTCFEINVIGAAAILQAFIPSMRVRRAGKLLCMSSMVGQIPFPFASIYTASKFALEGLMQSLKFEVEPFGIHVAIIQPAQVSTNFSAKTRQLPPEGSPYRERVRRLVGRDNELIKAALTPVQAAQKIVKVIEQEKPRRFNQMDFMSTLSLFFNRILPMNIRDMLLVNHMDIKAPKM